MADLRSIIAALELPSASETLAYTLSQPKKAGLKLYKPTNRERLAAALGGDERGGLRRHFAEGLTGTGTKTGLLDFTPGALGFTDESARKVATPGQRVGGLAELAAGILPIPAARGAGRVIGRQADDVAGALLKSSRPASLTAEQVPYKASGYDIATRSPRDKRAYTAAAPWTDANGGDRLSSTLGYEAAPTQQGAGYWKPPDGPAEINPVQVHRPQIALTPEGAVSPADEAALNFAQAYRGLNDVQAGTPWHVMGDPAARPSDAYSLNLGGQPGPKEMQALDRTAAGAGGEVWNASDGVTLKTWDDPAEFDRALLASLPDAQPRTMAGSGYVDLSEELAQPGQGLATQKVLGYEAALQPEQQARVAGQEFQQLSQEAGALRGERARQFRVEGVRPDFDLLWKLQAEGGWDGVKRWIAQNGPKGLPVLAGWVALHEQQGQTPSAQ